MRHRCSLLGSAALVAMLAGATLPSRALADEPPETAEPAPAAQPQPPEPSPPPASEGAEPSGEQRARAKELADEGMSLVNSGQVDDGLAKLAEAQKLVPVPTLAAAAARAMVRAGRLKAAIEAYRATTRMPLPDWLKGLSRIKQTHEQKLATEELTSLLERVPKVRIKLLGIEAERVDIDGVPQNMAELDHEVFVDPGIHVFEASAGEAVVRKEVRLAERQAITVALRLEEDSRDAPPPPPLPVSQPVPPKDEGVAPGPLMEIGSYVAFGLAAAALAGTIATWVIGSGIAKDLEASCPDNRCDPALLGPDGIEDLDRYRLLRNTTIALGVVTGVLAATGVTLLLTAPSDEGATVALELAPSHVGVHARF